MSRSSYYDANLNRLQINFFNSIGTMRAARERKIRTQKEFLLDLLAQYMITGAIKFNPLPKSFKHRNLSVFSGLNDHDFSYYSEALPDLAETLEQMFDSLLHHCVGKIFVM